MKNAVISGFTLLHSIGEGGMAEVWYAENRLGKAAAVKILKPALALMPEVVSRFENEAKVMVTLNHPHIRQVFDFGVINDRPCIIMEYLEGADLSARLKKGERFSNTQLIEWWDQIADALNYTHAKEVVHRDIKPSNIFITTDGKLKLLDFGIAKIRGSVTITQTGSRMGTLMYMSPEQVKDSKHLDYRTDLYSLAVTFYHLHTGYAPYDNTKSSEFEIQTKIVNEHLQLDKLPQAWSSFLAPYLKKDPQDRPRLTNFSSIPQSPPPPPQPKPEPQPTPDPVTEIKKPIPQPIKPPQAIKGKSYTPYWLLAAAVMVIAVLLIVNSNKNNERTIVASSQGKPSDEWVNIPAGTFTMGSPQNEEDRSDDETQHQVTLSAFKMSKYEVTFAQYDLFCDVTGRSKPSDQGWGRGRRPVINVSWDDAKAFADWMGCRLPTEAEWEYAARAGTTTAFSTGNCLSTAQANYDGNNPYSGCSKGEYRQKTLPVGSFPANAWGLHDMHGNVWEWCSDWYGAYPTAAQTNPKGSASGSHRVIRGGSWIFNARYCRSAYRNISTPAGRSNFIGFRLVSPK